MASARDLLALLVLLGTFLLLGWIVGTWLSEAIA